MFLWIDEVAPIMQVQVNLMSSMTNNLIPIGDLARRSGVAASALRFYEAQGLLNSQRNDSGRRQFARGDLRRVAFIRAA